MEIKKFVTSIFARGVNPSLRPTTPYHAKQGYRVDLDRNFRSQMEANVFRFLREIPRSISRVEYEPQYFQFTKGNGYLPDFRVTYQDGSYIYIEVKGYFDYRSYQRIYWFKTEYPKEPLYLITDKEYKKIKRLYSQRIKGWEY